jgi:hypothetical protein
MTMLHAHHATVPFMKANYSPPKDLKHELPLVGSWQLFAGVLAGASVAEGC